MSARGIYVRLFIISAVFLTALVGGLLLFQMRYFGSIYTTQKSAQFFADMQAARDGIDGKDLSQQELADTLSGIKRKTGAGSLGVYPTTMPSGPETGLAIKKLMVAGTIADQGDSNSDQVAANNLIDAITSGAIPSQPREETTKLEGQEGQYALFIQRVTIGGEVRLMIGVASLQPVDEAVRLLSDASWLVFGAAVLVSLALSAAIAAAIARPLIREVEHEKALDARRREFIAHASHELKTPLSIISSYAESLLDDVVSGGERRAYEQVIFDETQRMARLVRQMLDISRMQDTRVALQQEEIRLDGLVERALRRFERRIDEKRITVEVEKNEAAAIVGDETQIDLALDNLVSNAIFHTPNGGRVRVALSDCSGGARFEIENQGEPIPDEMLGRIWDSFFRADQARQRDDGRYGLGLSIVKLSIEKQGGRVGVRNAPGGVVFFFELPRG